MKNYAFVVFNSLTGNVLDYFDDETVANEKVYHYKSLFPQCSFAYVCVSMQKVVDALRSGME